MKRKSLSVCYGLLLSHLWWTSLALGQFQDKAADLHALPKAPPEFDVTLIASEPLVRQPCSMAFDERGRLFVGMGPQYRNPTPDTPGDSVVIVHDTDGDGQADQTKTFATGFNAIQGLAWHGRDLWVANAPDLTIVRDLNGDDEAEEYVKVYTDLGNLEHGLHGLNWAPDGRLYMSKGNSKGLNQPGRYAPKPFRDLWGVSAPANVPDMPSPVKFSKDNYRRSYHDPADDWGLDGGILRCDDGGENLEIVARGFRNPWDIHFDSGFNWIGTDNDQTMGDRVFMPFFGAHFGWNHSWSSHWGTESHAPTAPVSGPLFEGSGTGVVFCQSPQFPPEYRGAFLVNDWLQKKTYVWRPQWDGAIMRPVGGEFTSLIEGRSSLFRPTDMAFGPDGALWVLGWSSGYGAEWKEGQLTNEGRIYRVAWKNAQPVDHTSVAKPLNELSIDELLQEFDSPLSVRCINAQDALVQRGAENKEVRSRLLQRLTQGNLLENQETWTAWALGRMPHVAVLSEHLQRTLQPDSRASLNLQVQSVRIMAYRAKRFSQWEGMSECLRMALQHPQPRVRFAGVQALHEVGLDLLNRSSQRDVSPSSLRHQLLEAIQNESDPVIFYAGWQAMRVLYSQTDLRSLLSDSRALIRRAALLALLETHAISPEQCRVIVEKDADPEVRKVAELWLSKSGGSEPRIAGRPLQVASVGSPAQLENLQTQTDMATVRNIKVKSGATYKVVPGGFKQNAQAYVDRSYRLKDLPPELAHADLLQTANEDDNSSGSQWLSAEALVPVRVLVGMDDRQKNVPVWLLKTFQKETIYRSDR